MNSSLGDLVAAMMLGSIFLFSAWPKLRSPRSFLVTVQVYDVLPPALGQVYGRIVPSLEMSSSLLLFMGIYVRSASVILSLLLVSFMIAIAINMSRGRVLDCQCFGKRSRRMMGWKLILQDGAFLLAALMLAVRTSWNGLESWSAFHLLSPLINPGPIVAASLAAVCLGIPGASAMLARERRPVARRSSIAATPSSNHRSMHT